LTAVRHIPCRLYGSYLSRVLDIEVVNMEMEATEGVEKLVIDMLVQLLRLGIYIHKLGRVRPSLSIIIRLVCVA